MIIKRVELVGRLSAHFQGHEKIKVTCFERDLAIEEMPAAYRAADIVLILSKSEGNPLPALEGAACGTTLVTTAVGIIPELVSDGVDGFIVKGETDDELFDSTVTTLERLAGNRSLVESAKKALSNKVRRLYSWDVVGAAWEKFICAAIEVANSL
jgi:glycosyltransferase involved in cell wall biosynthesis